MNAINSEFFHKKNYESAAKEREILRSSDLDKLVSALLVCMENYEQLAAATPFPELKAIYKHYAGERADYAASLYARLGQDDRLSINEEGGIIGQLKPAWAGTLFTNTESDDTNSLLNHIINNELSAIKKYDDYLRNHIPVIKDLNLLVWQQESIKQVVTGL
ncbi:MAG TPA: hypothetical protein VL442_15035 [Mucilaginibacter sp.]|jgi:hypothetical protein|nr:hypothetical protein [Mucilaginibacter sp.]